MTASGKYTFDEFFKKATKNQTQSFVPYPYQRRLASLDEIPDILNIPTGAGKTEAVVLSIYLWRRFFRDKQISKNTPRRLIYCLPMRVLVEQTIDRIEMWIKNLELDDKVSVVTMMGGDTEKQYSMEPEKDLIIVGTQDMLLSRALNRGYADNQFRWPVDFGLLNNDCLWILDEIQLMHNGLTTSIQLESFRQHFGVFGPCKTIWMSATINNKWFETVDFDPTKCIELTLNEEDKKDQTLVKRNEAVKILRKSNLSLVKKQYSSAHAEYIIKKHTSGTITLVIVNTVERAQVLFKLLFDKLPDTCILLVHSRFRQKERNELNKKLQNISKSQTDVDVIIVATQVIEAGIDISAKTLITEIAPWPSLVQRFGRCNRKGEHGDSEVHIIELDKENYAPYDEFDMDCACNEASAKYDKSISPSSIGKIDTVKIHESVIRKSDIVGLFDTSPDLSGNYTDVSMYVRSLDLSTDVSVVWRSWTGGNIPLTKVMPEEICNVPKTQLEKFEKDKWRFNTQNKTWEKQTNVYPGQLILLESESGGYSNDIGWNLKSTNIVDDVSSSHKDKDSINDDEISYNSDWITLNDHTIHVINQTKHIVEKLDYLHDFNNVFFNTALYHDLGKAHHVFQETMTKNANDVSVSGEFWAKRRGSSHHSRYNYRHEAISALALLELKPNMPMLDLVAYLIASHHGKVRLSMRNTYKRNKNDNEYNSQYLLGIDTESEEKVDIFLFEQDKTTQCLPPLLASGDYQWDMYQISNEKKTDSKTKSIEHRLVDTQVSKVIPIKTDITKIGTRNECQSWLEMTLNLLKKYGPFRLAFMEAIIRAADTKASFEENKNVK